MYRYLPVIFLSLFFLAGCSMFFHQEEIDHHSREAAKANVMLATAFLNQGLVREAKQKLLLAKKLDSQEPSVWYGLGYLHEMMDEKYLAKINYEYAITVKPKDGAAHNNYGTFLCRMGQYEKSINQFVKAINDPEYLDTAIAYKNAGICALKMQDQRLANYYFQKAFLGEKLKPG